MGATGSEWSKRRTVPARSSELDHFNDIIAIRGTMGADSFTGARCSGTERFLGYGGNDTFDGSDGINEVDYRAEARAVGTGMIIELGTGEQAIVTDATGDEDTLTLSRKSAARSTMIRSPETA